MEKIQSACTKRLTRIFRNMPELDVNLLGIITEFLYATDMKTGSILIDATHFMPPSCQFRTASRKLFVVTRRTRKHVYIRELTMESKYRKKFVNRLGQMAKVITHPYDKVDRVIMFTPDEIPNCKIFVKLADNLKTLKLPHCMDIDFVKDRYRYLKQLFC